MPGSQRTVRICCRISKRMKLTVVVALEPSAVLEILPQECRSSSDQREGNQGMRFNMQKVGNREMTQIP